MFHLILASQNKCALASHKCLQKSPNRRQFMGINIMLSCIISSLIRDNVHRPSAATTATFFDYLNTLLIESLSCLFLCISLFCVDE